MFKAISVRQSRIGNRLSQLIRWVIDLDATEINLITINGKKHVPMIADRNTMLVLKSAMQVQVNRTDNPKFFDPVADKEQIELVLQTAENLRKIFDEVSRDG